jgi:hypothetical protein
MISIAPFEDRHLPEVGRFLHRHHDPTRSAEGWAALFQYPWGRSKPNNGFLLYDDERLAGVIGGIYSEQSIRGKVERFCNITSWAVEEPYRGHSNRLLMTLLAQKDCHFTNFSPMEVVEKTLRFLNFKVLDTHYTVIANLPTAPAGVTGNLDGWAGRLPEDAARTYRDHQAAPNLIHVVLHEGSRYCYVALLRDVVKGLPSGLVMHASDRELFEKRLRSLGAYLLLRYGMATMKVDGRLLTSRHTLSSSRPLGVPKYFKSATLAGADISNLYSERVLL